MTLLEHIVLKADDLIVLGDGYDQIVGLAGGARALDTPTPVGYAVFKQLFISLATDPRGRRAHRALRVKGEATVRLAPVLGAEVRH